VASLKAETAGGASPRGLLEMGKLKEAPPAATRGSMGVVDVSAVGRVRISQLWLSARAGCKL